MERAKPSTAPQYFHSGDTIRAKLVLSFLNFKVKLNWLQVVCSVPLQIFFSLVLALSQIHLHIYSVMPKQLIGNIEQEGSSLICSVPEKCLRLDNVCRCPSTWTIELLFISTTPLLLICQFCFVRFTKLWKCKGGFTQR